MMVSSLELHRCFCKEPIENDHPFLSTKNLLITPHLGASTVEAKEGAQRYM